ncbi:uncharacterized protein MAM_04405 [Metarhizium album ARSEF 1941]|uniref:Uncharacterized protein n=1 Tax=Metarhizium album (strain ARSEF 1941) TaxID=1081103 RepID=A0A0B2WPP4_METAS|nr:uncharacterized protein MAM_04405 [Metarhizium album ARSEF 1941]KHN98016.1 hypothetical protein MAM_04405 [Metarhizium album ARSEF 1941]
MKVAAAISVALAPYLAHATFALRWYFRNPPPDGLADATFPLLMRSAGHVEGYFFAYQFQFDNIPNVAYIGIQPRPDYGGRSVVHAAFSSFQGGTETSHPNCYYGADGGPGVSCAIDVYGDYWHRYNLVVENIRGTTWRGRLVNEATGQSHEIGVWTLPRGAGNMQSWGSGFIEHYMHDNCRQWPKIGVTFFEPSSTSTGNSGSVLDMPTDYGVCRRVENLQVARTDEGFRINYGRA